VLVFHCCDKIPDRNDLWEETFMLAYTFSPSRHKSWGKVEQSSSPYGGRREEERGGEERVDEGRGGQEKENE
jgi:hypothetical protein